MTPSLKKDFHRNQVRDLRLLDSSNYHPTSSLFGEPEPGSSPILLGCYLALLNNLR